MSDIGLTAEWDDLDAAFEELEVECQRIIAGVSVELWNLILQRTPQMWGRMTASWSYSLESPKFTDRSDEVYIDPDGAPKRQGDNAAISVANANSLGAQGQYRLGQTIWIANGVNHGQGPYASEVESGGIYLRSVNQPGAPLARSIDSIENKYGDGMSEGQAARLKSLMIGGQSS